MSELMDILNNLSDMGLYDVALPFLLIFTLIFAILQKSKILGTQKNLNVIVSLVIGFMFIRNQQLVSLVNSFLPNVSMFIVVFLMLLLLIAIFLGDDYKGWGNNLLAVAGIGSIIAIIWSLSGDYVGNRFALPDWLTGFDSRTKTMVIFIAIFVLIIWLVAKEPSSGKLWDYLGKGGEQLKGSGGGGKKD